VPPEVEQRDGARRRRAHLGRRGRRDAARAAVVDHLAEGRRLCCAGLGDPGVGGLGCGREARDPRRRRRGRRGGAPGVERGAEGAPSGQAGRHALGAPFHTAAARPRHTNAPTPPRRTAPAASYPTSACPTLLVRPLWISCLCRCTAVRARPRPSSSEGAPAAPCERTAASVDLPLSVPPATAGVLRGVCGGFGGVGVEGASGLSGWRVEGLWQSRGRAARPRPEPAAVAAPLLEHTQSHTDTHKRTHTHAHGHAHTHTHPTNKQTNTRTRTHTHTSTRARTGHAQVDAGHLLEGAPLDVRQRGAAPKPGLRRGGGERVWGCRRRGGPGRGGRRGSIHQTHTHTRCWELAGLQSRGGGPPKRGSAAAP
jgi:hypothetical protein